jgi:hypothetical protein
MRGGTAGPGERGTEQGLDGLAGGSRDPGVVVVRSGGHGQVPADGFPTTGTSREGISDGHRHTLLVGAAASINPCRRTRGVSLDVSVALRHGGLPCSSSRKSGKRHEP